MKKEFDIEKIGKAMPYKAPSEEFFKDFSSNVMMTIKARRHKRMIMWRSCAAAAVVVFGVVLGVTNFEREQTQTCSLDNYLLSLSDEELNSLIADNQYVDDFYSNL